MSQLNDDPCESAKKNGQVVVLTQPRELFVDIDNEEDYRVLLAHIEIMTQLGISIEFDHISPSKSGFPRQHVYLSVDHELGPMERIALQACLGSDRKRELLSMCRVYLNDRPPTVFFENADHPKASGAPGQ